MVMYRGESQELYAKEIHRLQCHLEDLREEVRDYIRETEERGRELTRVKRENIILIFAAEEYKANILENEAIIRRTRAGLDRLIRGVKGRMKDKTKMGKKLKLKSGRSLFPKVYEGLEGQ